MFKRHIASALVFGMAATAPPAEAQSLRCASRDTVTERLTARYSEVQTGLGLQSDSKLVEIWSSMDTGSWTILLTLPDGNTCVLASGNHWHNRLPDTTPAKNDVPS